MPLEWPGQFCHLITGTIVPEVFSGAESFFSMLKLELIPDKAFVSREAARLAVFD